MKKQTGYTLTELLITIAVIGIVGALIVGAFMPKKAGAAEPALPDYLRGESVEFIYNYAGYLTVFKTGNLGWTTAADACDELKSLNSPLKRVTLHTSNGRSEADCN